MKNVLKHAAAQGRNGDDTLLHVSQDELKDLAKMGTITINPATGLPEAWGLGDIFKVIGPVIGGVIGGPLGSATGITATAGSALGAGLGSLLTGGGGKGALLSSGMSLLGSSLFGAPDGGVHEGADFSGDDVPDTGDVFADSEQGASILEGITNQATDSKTLTGLAIAGLMGSGMGSSKDSLGNKATKPAFHGDDSKYGVTGPKREYNPYLGDYNNYGYKQEHNYFSNNHMPGVQKLAEGGNPLFLAGSSGGQDDQVPAMLSDGEFVIPADVVSALGEGNNDAGADKLYKMLQGVRKAAFGHTKQMKKVPNNVLSAALEGMNSKKFALGGQVHGGMRYLSDGSGGSAGGDDDDDGGGGGSSSGGGGGGSSDAGDSSNEGYGTTNDGNYGGDFGSFGGKSGFDSHGRGDSDETDEGYGTTPGGNYAGDFGAFGGQPGFDSFGSTDYGEDFGPEQPFSIHNPKELNFFERLAAKAIDGMIGMAVGPGSLALSGMSLATGLSPGKAMMGAYGPGEDPGPNADDNEGNPVSNPYSPEANPFVNTNLPAQGPSLLAPNLGLSPLRLFAQGGMVYGRKKGC